MLAAGAEGSVARAEPAVCAGLAPAFAGPEDGAGFPPEFADPEVCAGFLPAASAWSSARAPAAARGALALTVFVYAQYVGLRGLGLVGYLDHLMGSPRNLTGWLLVPLMLPIHVMGELAKPISLSCRLFGNIFGEDMLLVAFATLGISVLAWSHLPFGLPLQVPFLLLALLTSTLQALVFMVLSTIYILLMLPHDEHEHEGEAQHAH